MSWFDTERPHIVILCIIKHKLQKYYLSNSKSTNLYIRIRACLDQRLIAIRSQGILRDNVRSKIWVIAIN